MVQILGKEVGHTGFGLMGRNSPHSYYINPKLTPTQDSPGEKIHSQRRKASKHSRLLWKLDATSGMEENSTALLNSTVSLCSQITSPNIRKMQRRLFLVSKEASTPPLMDQTGLQRVFEGLLTIALSF